MSKKTHIDVKVSVDSIRENLRKKILSENSQMITDVIIGNLDRTEIGLEMLFKALNGVVTVPKYKIGDWVLVNYDLLYGWQFDKSRSEELLIQGRLRAQIRLIDMCRKSPYTIAYSVFKTKVGQLEELKSDIQEEYICLEDEWPLDPDPDKDLPF